MVDSIEITNFRGFESLKISDLALVNVIVGDNAVGKTALLEAIYLTLCGNAQKPLSVRQWRGLGATFQAASGDALVEGLYSDLFHDPESQEPITIKLTGRGFENRQLVISKSRGDITVPTKAREPEAKQTKGRSKQKIETAQEAQIGAEITAPITLTWIDEHGTRYETHVILTPNGLRFEGTGESLPNCFMYAAQISVLPEEAASHYSALRKRRDIDQFRRVFMSIFREIKDISVENVGGSSAILADVPWAKQLLPLPVLSGGTTRIASILLALAFRKEGVVLVDEIDSGIYHMRQERFAKALLEMSRSYNSQLIMTTHSEEWLNKFAAVLSKKAKDVAFWRMERIGNEQATIQRMSAARFIAGLAAGEMR